MGPLGRAEALVDDTRTFTMIALDHRESLRTIMREACGPGAGTDDQVRTFKLAGITALAPIASAVLIDRETASTPACRAAIPPSTAVIVAADEYDQPPGTPIVASGLDEHVTADVVARCAADALKLLVLWYPNEGQSERQRLLERFHALNDRCGTASVLEGVVRPARGGQWRSVTERADAVLAAAAELCEMSPDLYKAEIPGYWPGDLSMVRRQAVELTGQIGRPWVVLSSGVRRDDFPPAMAEACAGGAYGFLAGRAVWTDVIGRADVESAFRDVGAARVRSLIDVAHDAVLSRRSQNEPAPRY